MRNTLGLGLAATVALTLGSAPVRSAEVSSAATSACTSAVNSQYGGNVRDLKIISSQFSQANSEVMIRAIGVRGGNTNEKWRCLVSNTGDVQDLSVISSGDGKGAASSSVSEAAKSGCMSAVNKQYGGNVRNLKVHRSEFSEANSVVIIRAIGVRGGDTNEKWRCLVSNSGEVQEVRVMGN
jgi:hypothetical protein